MLNAINKKLYTRCNQEIVFGYKTICYNNTYNLYIYYIHRSQQFKVEYDL